MAAEIAGPEAATCPECLRFNEAAANGRGNLGVPPAADCRGMASMRPRRMAAEIVHGRLDDGHATDASMRPRRMAAEIRAVGGGDAGQLRGLQ